MSLAINVATGFAIFTIVFILTKSIAARKGIDNPQLEIVIPLSFVLVITLAFIERLWTKVKGREGAVYLDNLLTRELIVYMKGFHFTSWFFSNESDTQDFKRQEIMEADQEKKTGIVMVTKDGYEVVISLRLMFSLGSRPEDLCKSLRYNRDDLKNWIWSYTVGSLSDLMGCNDYATLLANKADIATWLANLFCGTGNVSPLEDETGTDIKNPILLGLNPTEESLKLFEIQARNKAIAEGIEGFIAAGADPKEAAIMAQTSAGTATREIRTFQGFPDGATVIALDSGAAAAAANKGGGNKPKNS